MKVIDLLNKVANGEEVPEKIKLSTGRIFNLDEDNAYWCDDIDYSSNWLSNEFTFGTKSLNDEVEIIEEGKEIPEKINNAYYHETQDIQNEIFKNKINEIIDYLESKEGKQ